MKIIERSDPPLPVLLNCWKHHLGFIKEQIKTIRLRDSGSLEYIRQNLLTIGESQMDLYLGELSPAEIGKQVIDRLNESGIISFNNYKTWIANEGKEYRLITLDDDSIWTLRLGIDKKRYVHIHPARNTLNTIRVKATTLKTAIIALCWIKVYGGLYSDLEIINKVRKDFLSEPPLKNVSVNKGLIKLISIFLERIS
jgi:hypothetical protein